jgi:hypothetical protein
MSRVVAARRRINGWEIFIEWLLSRGRRWEISPLPLSPLPQPFGSVHHDELAGFQTALNRGFASLDFVDGDGFVVIKI